MDIITGCSIIQTTTTHSFLSLNAAAGNSAAITITGNASTTNASATTIFNKLDKLDLDKIKLKIGLKIKLKIKHISLMCLIK